MGNVVLALLIEGSTPSSIEDRPVGEGREYRKTRSAMPSGQHGVGVSEVARGEAFGGRHNLGGSLGRIKCASTTIGVGESK